MKRLLCITLLFLGIAGFIVTLSLPEVGFAATPKEEICSGVGAASGTAGCGDGDAQINNIVKVVVNLLSLVVGIVAVIMVIVSGFMYVTSAGDSGKLGTAKNTLIYAIVGIVVVALAQFIVQFVLGKIK